MKRTLCTTRAPYCKWSVRKTWQTWRARTDIPWRERLVMCRDLFKTGEYRRYL